MRAGRRAAGALVALALALAVCAPGPAWAFHAGDEHLIDGTAHTLQAREWRFGVWDIAWGPTGWLTVDTYVWPWLKKVVNVSAKLRLWAGDAWALSARLGYFRVNAQDLAPDASPVIFHVVPVELAASWRFAPSWELSVTGVYTPIVQKGVYDADDFKGAAGYTNTQLAWALEWRLNERWALFLRARHLLHMQVGGKLEQTWAVDAYTTIQTQGAASSQDVGDLGFPRTFQIVPGFAYSRASFNLELGLGYGNLHVPGVNVFLPIRWPVPQVDVAWRW